MGGSQVRGKAVWAQALVARVERWRESKRKGSAMPGELWQAAASLAAEHGVYAVSRELRLRYDSLRRRVDQGVGQGAKEDGGGGFVEVSAAQLLGSAGGRGALVAVGAEVEVWGVSGARLVVRLVDGGGVDVAGVVSAFLSSRR